VLDGLGLLLGLGREGGSPGVGFSWAEVGPEGVHRLGHKSNMARSCISKKRGGAFLTRLFWEERGRKERLVSVLEFSWSRNGKRMHKPARFGKKQE
jgi:hypothetical protein